MSNCLTRSGRVCFVGGLFAVVCVLPWAARSCVCGGGRMQDQNHIVSAGDITRTTSRAHAGPGIGLYKVVSFSLSSVPLLS